MQVKGNLESAPLLPYILVQLSHVRWYFHPTWHNRWVKPIPRPNHMLPHTAKSCLKTSGFFCIIISKRQVGEFRKYRYAGKTIYVR